MMRFHTTSHGNAFFFHKMVEGPQASVSTQSRDCVITLLSMSECDWGKRADLGEVVVPRMHHGKIKITCDVMK